MAHGQAFSVSETDEDRYRAMNEEEAAMVLELHKKLVDAQSVLARCIQKMNQMPGSGDITGILARSTVNSISELLHRLQSNPFIVFPEAESEAPPESGHS